MDGPREDNVYKLEDESSLSFCKRIKNTKICNTPLQTGVERIFKFLISSFLK